MKNREYLRFQKGPHSKAFTNISKLLFDVRMFFKNRFHNQELKNEEVDFS